MRDEKGRFIKGSTPHNKGVVGYTNRGTFKKGEEHPRWNKKTNYSGIHKWIVRNYGRADHCDECGRIDCKRYDWANKDHLYSRDIKDWFQLCRSCHIKYDKNRR